MSQGFTKGIPIATDPTMALNSDLVVPSQAAVVAYVAGQIPSGGVLSVTATAPLASSGGANPTLSIPAASSTQSGYISAATYNDLNSRSTKAFTIAMATAL